MVSARNDVRYSLEQVGLANTSDALEFPFWMRVANGFLYEGIHALTAWRRENSEVRDFLRLLPPDGQGHLREVSGVEQRVGNKALLHLRNQVFHYAHPDSKRSPDSVDELRAVLADHTNVEFMADRTSGGGIRYTFADPVALSMAWSRHDSTDEANLIPQLEQVRDAGTAFSNLADDVFAVYVSERNVTPRIRTGRG